jgi:hypothetical protein
MSRNPPDLLDSQAPVLLHSHGSRRWHNMLGAGLAVLAVAGGSSAAEGPAPRAASAAEGPAPHAAAAAEDPAPRGVDWVSFLLELRAIGGGAAVGWTATDSEGVNDIPVVDQYASTFGLGLRAGFPIGSYVNLGYTASFARYSQVGELEVRDAEAFGDEYWLRETSYTLWSPVGVFLELYPITGNGFFFSLTGSLGWMPANTNLPPNTIDEGLIMAGYALEAGYEFDRTQKHGPGAFLRYAGWAGSQSPLYTDFPEGVDSRELTLGLRWTLRLGDD